MDVFRSKLKRLTGSFADPRLFQIFSLGILLAAGAYSAISPSGLRRLC